MLEDLRVQVEQITHRLQQELDYSKPDEEIFTDQKHIPVGSIMGFKVVLYKGAACISHPEWERMDGLGLSRYLSDHAFKNKLSKQVFDHYKVPHSYQPYCVMVDVVGRKPYFWGEEFQPPVKTHELRRLATLLQEYSAQPSI